MIKDRILVIILLLFAGMISVRAQGSGIRTEYLKDTKSTRVETNLLYIYNTPDQFIQLQFRTWYKGEKLTSPPSKVDLELFSFANKDVFRKNRSLVFIADGEETKPGSLSHTMFKGKSKDGVDVFYVAGGNPDIGMQVPIPQSAQIRGGSLDGITMESMSLSLKSDQFLTLAKSTQAAIRIGNTTLDLNARHMEILRNFSDQITPE